jgi:8-oxo-dGTP pyrophosphatase MutT (NUDIX family)
MESITMIVFDDGDMRFNYRVAGVCLQDEHVLVHRAESDDFWTLPGGRPEFLESSRAALAREMEEELGVTIEVGQLLWIAEYFFQHADRHFHEIAFYFEMTLPASHDFHDVRREFSRTDADMTLVFRWLPLGQIPATRLYPTFLRTGLLDLPVAPVHVVQTDPPK